MATQSNAAEVLRESQGNPIQALAGLGQSIWLDHIDREMIQSGRLRRMVEQDGLVGLTSNPAIFEKAIGHSKAYDEQLRELLYERDWEVKQLFEALSIQDIQNAADTFWKVFRSSFGRDGYVSYEVAPALALETELSILEARRLWSQIKRENVMIKIPGTPGNSCNST